MVVTRSREHAVRYKLAFDQYIKAKGYTDIKSLVALSGSPGESHEINSLLVSFNTENLHLIHSEEGGYLIY